MTAVPAIRVGIIRGELDPGQGAQFFRPLGYEIVKVVVPEEGMVYPDVLFEVGKAAAQALIKAQYNLDVETGALSPEEAPVDSNA